MVRGAGRGRADYNEWGEITYREALSITSSYRRIYPQSSYTGHDWDDVLGMYYAKARFYSAEDKRFVSMDPVKGQITEPLSLVPYVYCVDNPLKWVDPLGLSRVNTNSELADTGHSQALNKASTFPVGTIMEVARNGVNLHMRADVNSPVSCQLNKGYLVTILGQTMSRNGYRWEHINFKGKVGWVMGDQLRLGYDVVPSGPSAVPSASSTMDMVQVEMKLDIPDPEALLLEQKQEEPTPWEVVAERIRQVGKGIAIGVTVTGLAIVIVADWAAGNAAAIAGWRATLGHTIQDFELDPFGAVSAIEDATKDIPGLGNVSAHVINNYQGFIHFGTDLNVDFYDDASDFLNHAHDFTGGVKEWLGDTYHDVMGCPGVSQETLDEVTAMPWGTRPDPSTYLPQEYIDRHLAQFKGGVTKFIGSKPIGTVGRDAIYVLPKSVADHLEFVSAGSVDVLTDALGLPRGYLGTTPYRVDIPSPEGLRISSGNEMGAKGNPWIAGGFTSEGLPEAVINPVDPGSYVWRQVWGR